MVRLDFLILPDDHHLSHPPPQPPRALLSLDLVNNSRLSCDGDTTSVSGLGLSLGLRIACPYLLRGNMVAVCASLRSGALVYNLRRGALSWGGLPLLDLGLCRGGLWLRLLLLWLLRLLLLLLLLLLGVVDGAGRNIKAFIDLLGDRLDLGSEFLLDAVKVEAILVRDKVNR